MGLHGRDKAPEGQWKRAVKFQKKIVDTEGGRVHRVHVASETATTDRQEAGMQRNERENMIAFETHTERKVKQSELAGLNGKTWHVVKQGRAWRVFGLPISAMNGARGIVAESFNPARLADFLNIDALKLRLSDDEALVIEWRTVA